YGLGLTLGNAEVRLLELTNAYACLARLGEYKPYRMTRNRSGGLPTATRSERRSNGGLETTTTKDRHLSTQRGGALSGRRLFNPSAAWLIADILSDPVARAETFGLGSHLDLPFRVAAKTGTSTDFR